MSSNIEEELRVAKSELDNYKVLVKNQAYGQMGEVDLFQRRRIKARVKFSIDDN